MWGGDTNQNNDLKTLIEDDIYVIQLLRIG